MDRVIGTFLLVVTSFVFLCGVEAEESLSLKEATRWLSSEAARVVRGNP